MSAAGRDAVASVVSGPFLLLLRLGHVASSDRLRDSAHCAPSLSPATRVLPPPPPLPSQHPEGSSDRYVLTAAQSDGQPYYDMNTMPGSTAGIRETTG